MNAAACGRMRLFCRPRKISPSRARGNTGPRFSGWTMPAWCGRCSESDRPDCRSWHTGRERGSGVRCAGLVRHISCRGESRHQHAGQEPQSVLQPVFSSVRGAHLARTAFRRNADKGRSPPGFRARAPCSDRRLMRTGTHVPATAVPVPPRFPAPICSRGAGLPAGDCRPLTRGWRSPCPKP